MILGKKVVENKTIWNNWQTFFSRFNHILVIVTLFIFWVFNYSIPKEEITFFNIVLMIVATLWLYVTYPLRRIAYANEKVTVLQPFAMLYQVFPIIISFIFITSEKTNLITFITAILASLVVILANVNLKNLKINKYCLMVLSSSCIKSFQIFSCLYFLKILSPASFYFTESIIVLIISIILIFFKKEIWQLKTITKKYAKLLLFTNTVVITSILLSLTMYSSFWVVLTNLISLLYLIFIYILGYLFLKDIPSKKDILVTIFIAICIVIWVFFKI